MKERIAVGWLILLLFALTGCDAFHTDDGSGAHMTLSMKTSKLGAVRALAGGCANSIETAVLTVNGREARQDVAGDTVTFEVSGIDRGEVVARAVILSNSGDTLYVGEDRRTIREPDFGTIDLQVDKLRPVIEVCPDSLTLYADRQYLDTLYVINKGSRPTGSSADSLLWSADAGTVCEGGVCAAFRPRSGVTVVPNVSMVLVVHAPVAGAPAPAMGEMDVPIRSAYGDASVHVRIGQGP